MTVAWTDLGGALIDGAVGALNIGLVFAAHMLIPDYRMPLLPAVSARIAATGRQRVRR